MGTPELIRQITDSRRKEREALEAKKLSEQRSPEEVAQEVAKAKAEQIEANEMFHNMRSDCESLLKNRGAIKTRGLFRIKYKSLETLIPDKNGEEVSITLISSKIDPAFSDIRLVVGIVFGGFIPHTEADSFVKFEEDDSHIVNLVPKAIPRVGVMMEEHKRKPNLQDAREWKEVVDALKEQN